MVLNPGEFAIVAEFPTCDICKFVENTPGVIAKYDAKTIQGPWANLCERHFQSYGIGLGIGLGQQLVLHDSL